MSETSLTERDDSVANETTPLKYYSFNFSSRNNKDFSDSPVQQKFYSVHSFFSQHSQSLEDVALSPRPSYLPPLSISYSHLSLIIPPQNEDKNLDFVFVENNLQENVDKKLLGSKSLPTSVTNRGSLLLMIFINFLSNVIFSIVLPSLPTFVETVGGSPSHVGWAVAVNSLGTFVTSPVFGWLADRVIGFRWVFFLSFILMFGGSMWYSLCTDIYELLAARFVVGVAAANYAPAGAYLSYASRTESRNKIMAWASAATVLGFICGPAFALLTSFKFVEFKYWIFYFTSYTAPGYISAALSLIGMLCLIRFKEPEVPSAASTRQTSTSLQPPTTLNRIEKLHLLTHGVLVLLVNCFIFTTVFTVFETVTALYMQDDFAWGVMWTSITYLGISVLCLLALVSLQVLTHCASDRVLMFVFMCVMTLGVAFFINWDSLISFPRFLAGISLTSIGYANAQALLLTLYSKLLDQHKQGVMMGWLSSSSSIARMICPIGASYIYNLNANGPNIVFMCTTALSLVAVVLTLTAFRHLIPPTSSTPCPEHTTINVSV